MDVNRGGTFGLSYYIRRRDSRRPQAFRYQNTPSAPNLCSGVGRLRNNFSRGNAGAVKLAVYLQGEAELFRRASRFIGSQAHEFRHGYLAAVDGEAHRG